MYSINTAANAFVEQYLNDVARRRDA